MGFKGLSKAFPDRREDSFPPSSLLRFSRPHSERVVERRSKALPNDRVDRTLAGTANSLEVLHQDLSSASPDDSDPVGYPTGSESACQDDRPGSEDPRLPDLPKDPIPRRGSPGSTREDIRRSEDHRSPSRASPEARRPSESAPRIRHRRSEDRRVRARRTSPETGGLPDPPAASATIRKPSLQRGSPRRPMEGRPDLPTRSFLHGPKTEGSAPRSATGDPAPIRRTGFPTRLLTPFELPRPGLGWARGVPPPGPRSHTTLSKRSFQAGRPFRCQVRVPSDRKSVV